MDPLFAVLSYSNVSVTQLEFLSNVTSDIQTQINNTASAITGAASSITTSNLSPNVVLVSDAVGKVSASAVPSANLAYVANLTSDAQTQLNAKAATITGAATTITSANLTASRAIVSDASGKVVASGVPSANLLYIANVTSDAQQQLNAKADLTNATFTGNVTVQGNFAVSGTTTTLNTEQLTVQDPVVVLNTGALNQASGVYVLQPTGPNVAVVVQNNAVEFLSTSSQANATSFTGSFATLRAGNVNASSLTTGTSTLTEASGALLLQRGGANVLSANGSHTILEGNVSIKPVGVGHVRSVGGSSAGNAHTILSSQLDTKYNGTGTFGGQLLTYITGPGGKSGFAMSSILKSSVEFELVPLLVHRNANLSTLNLGVFQGNVRVETDASCQVFWTFDGALVN